MRMEKYEELRSGSGFILERLKRKYREKIAVSVLICIAAAAGYALLALIFCIPYMPFEGFGLYAKAVLPAVPAAVVLGIVLIGQQRKKYGEFAQGLSDMPDYWQMCLKASENNSFRSSLFFTANELICLECPVILAYGDIECADVIFVYQRVYGVKMKLTKTFYRAVLKFTLREGEIRKLKLSDPMSIKTFEADFDNFVEELKKNCGRDIPVFKSYS